ncbi:MAG TPA: protein kinase [Gemmatimonadaceae bacterium]|nr:protein kinase [Gemmatimonadaceae bacterium]
MLDSVKAALESKYSIERELGRGGMATVYLAQDLRHGREVAVKVLHPELASAVGADRFLREIKLSARLNHPHILPLFDSGEASGFLFYVMPYIEGESLRDRMNREGQLSLEDSLAIGRAVAGALDYAHRRQIVHRDIKPENIMLNEEMAMVMDFGIAKAVSVAGTETLTQTGMVVGTPAYVSPEQAAGELEIDGRSDQYSLGCVLYEMLTGERPFTGPTAQAVLTKRFTAPVPSLSEVLEGVPDEIDRALSKAMAKDAAARYTTSGEFARALVPPVVTTPTAAIPVPEGAQTVKSIAVIPFTNMSADPENEYFTDGMAEEIINALSKIKSLSVASRTSSFAFKGKTEDIRGMGRKLEVAAVLEGSVRKMGNKIRISVQLINVANGYQLWSERYDREIEDVFAIQDEIAQNIVKALRVVLSEEEKQAITKAPTENVEAYDYYLRGRQFFHQHRRTSIEFARQMFTRAIEIDPEYALAHSGIADCCSILYMYFDARESNLKQADSASRKALQLDPQLAEAHSARGLAFSLSKQYEQAMQEFETAMKLDPKLYEAPYFYGRACLAQGKWFEAAPLFEKAANLRPDDYQAVSFLSAAYAGQGRIHEASKASHRAVGVIERWLDLNPDDARALNLGATIWSNLGQKEKALEWARRSLVIDKEDPQLLYNVACVYAIEGMKDDAILTLERAIDKGYGHKEWIEHDSDLNSLRSDKRFQALLERM